MGSKQLARNMAEFQAVQSPAEVKKAKIEVFCQVVSPFSALSWQPRVSLEKVELLCSMSIPEGQRTEITECTPKSRIGQLDPGFRVDY